jgi:RNA polymerase sigma factor (sigma-70 family)
MTTTTSPEWSHDAGGCRGDGAHIADLLCRARVGDQAAVGEIVERCTPMLRAVARRYVHGDSDVDDVLQDVWIAFVENLHLIREPAATRGWLLRVLTHAAIRAGQQARRAEPTAELDVGEPVADVADVAVRNVWLEDLRGRLKPALQALRPEDRRLVTLLAGEGRSDYRTVSRLTGRPVGSIGPTRMRAMARLRRQPSLVGLDRSA